MKRVERRKHFMKKCETHQRLNFFDILNVHPLAFRGRIVGAHWKITRVRAVLRNKPRLRPAPT